MAHYFSRCRCQCSGRVHLNNRPFSPHAGALPGCAPSDASIAQGLPGHQRKGQLLTYVTLQFGGNQLGNTRMSTEKLTFHAPGARQRIQDTLGPRLPTDSATNFPDHYRWIRTVVDHNVDATPPDPVNTKSCLVVYTEDKPTDKGDSSKCLNECGTSFSDTPTSPTSPALPAASSDAKANCPTSSAPSNPTITWRSITRAIQGYFFRRFSTPRF